MSEETCNTLGDIPDSDPSDDDLHGSGPGPEKIEAAVEKMKELGDFSLDVLQSSAVDKGLREIFRKGLETKDLRYLGSEGSKCDEKI